MSLDDLKYATPGAWGPSSNDRPLLAPEADGNTWIFRQAIEAIEATPGVGIANIAVTGRQFTVYLTDSSTLGPFLLPIATPRYRGVWANAVNYSAFDIVRVAGFGTYMVIQDHTSASTFDPYVGNSDGNYYVQIGPDPFYTAQVQDVSGTTLTLALSHQNKYLRASNVSGLAVTLNAGVFPLNAEIHFRQATPGAITVTAGAGVTINVPDGCDLATGSLGAVFTLKHIGSDVWDIFGKLAEASA